MDKKTYALECGGCGTIISFEEGNLRRITSKEREHITQANKFFKGYLEKEEDVKFFGFKVGSRRWINSRELLEIVEDSIRHAEKSLDCQICRHTNYIWLKGDYEN
jgi:hypothetical protein